MTTKDTRSINLLMNILDFISSCGDNRRISGLVTFLGMMELPQVDRWVIRWQHACSRYGRMEVCTRTVTSAEPSDATPSDFPLVTV